jgi:hypothetical protein
MKSTSEPTRESLVLYDVELVRVNGSKHTLTFRHEGFGEDAREFATAYWLRAHAKLD